MTHFLKKKYIYSILNYLLSKGSLHPNSFAKPQYSSNNNTNCIPSHLLIKTLWEDKYLLKHEIIHIKT